VRKYKFTLTFGGWYQRTTIHLSEIYYFLAKGKSKLPLSESKLKQLQLGLDLSEVTRKAGYLEYVHAFTKQGIEIRYYEDGLFVLELDHADILKGEEILKSYYEELFKPAIDYIFSLGAPTPKVLANIKKVHPLVVGVKNNNHKNYNISLKKFGEVYSKITSKDITVYKTHKYIFVVSKHESFKEVERLNEMQIFFREFKDHLEKYLEMHRVIWEEIARIKTIKKIKGTDIPKIREKLDSYSKTVTLISRRINQMGSYVKTRSSISDDLKVTQDLVKLFHYKYETLTNTLDYIKEIWAMTREYLDSAISIIVELQSKTLDAGLKSLRVVTTFGALAGMINYVSESRIPKLSLNSVIFFVGLVLAAILIDRLVVFIYQRMKYRMKFKKDVVRIS
jgi:hypothetical protein